MTLILPLDPPPRVFPNDPEMEQLFQEALALTKWKRERITKAIDEVLRGALGVKVAPSRTERTALKGILTRKLRGAIQWRRAEDKAFTDTLAAVVLIFRENARRPLRT